MRKLLVSPFMFAAVSGFSGNSYALPDGKWNATVSCGVEPIDIRCDLRSS